jgi:PAS domain S-box-containing protein
MSLAALPLNKASGSSRLVAYVLAFIATAFAVLGSWLLDPLLGDRFDYPLLYAGVAIAVWYGGWRPAVLALVTGYLAVHFLLVEPRSALALARRDWIGLLMYLFSCGVIIVIGESLHRSRQQVATQLSDLEQAVSARQKLQVDLALTLHCMDEFFSQYDSNWIIRYANEKQQRGDPRIAPAIAEERSLWTLWPDMVGTPTEDALRRCMKERVTVEADRYDSNLNRWYAVRAYPDPHGGLAMLVRDVTRARRVEKALRKSEEDYRQLFEGSAAGKAEAALHGGLFTRANRRFCELTQYSADELKQITMLDLTHPDDRERCRAAAERAARSGGEGFEMEKRYVRKDGETIWVQLSAVGVRDGSGALVGMMESIQDVTGHKQAEHEANAAAAELARVHRQLDESFAVLDTLLASAPVGLAFLDPQARFVRTNQALAAIHGSPVASQVGATVADLVPELWPQFEAMFFQALTGQATVSAELAAAMPSAPGQMRHWLVSAYPVRVEGAVIGVGLVVVDVTHQRLASEALKDAGRRKDEFLAMLAHELRNPLAPLRNALQLLTMSPDTSQAFQKVRPMMERQLALMVRLIDDLLDISRIGQGKITLTMTEVPLAVVIETAVEGSRPHFDAVGHTLTIEPVPDSIRVQVDPARMAQVFANLLNNAARYTSPGGRITVSVQCVDGRVEIAVQDNGMGVPPAMLGRIFNLFEQVERPHGDSWQRSGLGIGLALVRGLVELQGGSVRASSEGEGRGSRFTVALPAVTTSPAAEMALPPPVGVQRRRRILVVDDNTDAAQSLAMLLELMGHEVHTALDGLQAVAAVSAMEPDLVLLDIGMPGVDGYEACRRIRRLPAGRRVRVVAMTGWGQDDDRRRSHEAGFDRHLVKPAEPGEIERLLREMEALEESALPR